MKRFALKIRAKILSIVYDVASAVKHRNDWNAEYNEETGKWEMHNVRAVPYAIKMAYRITKCEIVGHQWEIDCGGDAESGPITYADCRCCGKTIGPHYGM